jgi:hypothetical protein
MLPSPYPSDLSDEEWQILEPRLSTPRSVADCPGGPHAGSRTPSSTYSGAAARGGCYRGSTLRGKRSATTSGAGATTDG